MICHFDMKTIEREWYADMTKRLSEFVAYLKKTQPEEWQESRLSFLKDEQRVVLISIAKIEKEYSDAAARHDPLAERMIASYSLPDWQKMAVKLAREIYFLESKQDYGQLSPEAIGQARAYPIENILEINKQGYARCISCDDKSAHLLCKGNFGYCFRCGYTSDVIGIAMKTRNLKFSEAVRFLTGG